MEVAPRYTLLSLFTLFEIFTLLYTAKTLASLLKYNVIRLERCWMQALWASEQN